MITAFAPSRAKSKHRFDTVSGAQEIFRLLLEALANPGRTVDLRPQAARFAAYGEWLALALTLLDNETGFFCAGIPEAAEEIRLLSGGVPVPLEAADFVFFADTPGNEPAAPAERVLSRVKAGSHADPHDSALIIVAAGGEADTRAALRGPGVPPAGRELRLSAAEAAWVKARDERAFEYPRGVELLFIRKDFSLTAITRKVTAAWR